MLQFFELTCHTLFIVVLHLVRTNFDSSHAALQLFVLLSMLDRADVQSVLNSTARGHRRYTFWLSR
jgi:hypothetical protein